MDRIENNRFNVRTLLNKNTLFLQRTFSRIPNQSWIPSALLPPSFGQHSFISQKKIATSVFLVVTADLAAHGVTTYTIISTNSQPRSIGSNFLKQIQIRCAGTPARTGTSHFTKSTVITLYIVQILIVKNVMYGKQVLGAFCSTFKKKN